MPLARPDPTPIEIERQLKALDAATLFPGARSPLGAMAGLFVYFGAMNDAHTIAQELHTREGSFWNGIIHRQEPDAFNAGYWFGQVGKHPVFPGIAEVARLNRFPSGPHWDPRAFIDYCESARLRHGSIEESIAMRIQLADWQLLFDYCASPEKIS